MTYKNDLSDFLQLTPRGVGFSDSTPQMSVDELIEIFQEEISKDDKDKLNLLFQEKLSDEVSKEVLNGFHDTLKCERKRLLEMCGYTVRMYSETQDILYQKAIFILQNKQWFFSNHPTSVYQSIVNILLADSCVLFTGTDEHFWHNRINNEGIASWNPLFNNSGESREKYRIEQANNFCNRFPEKVKYVYVAMLDIISKSAIKNHQSVESWVEKHLPYEDDADKNLVQLKEAFPKYADQMTRNFSEDFYLTVLNIYAKRVDMLSNKALRPSQLTVSVDQKAAQLFVYYKARLKRFENLHRKASEQKGNLEVIRAFLEFKHFFAITMEEGVLHTKHVAEICSAIHDFFTQCHSPLKEDGKGTLQQRIVWAISRTSIPSKLQPVFLVYMIICCNRNVARGVDCRVQSSPVFDPRYSKRKQRYFQLMLLNRLCDILSASKNNRMENWEQYLALQGTEILSVEEAQFWKQQLGTEYEQFPVIGFQLCCIDYIEDCVPLHLKHLSYDSAPQLRRGGYHDFWERNQTRIRLQAATIYKKYPKVLKEYKKFWSKPKEYYFTCKEWFKKVLEHDISVDLSEFGEIPACNKDELQRLVLETELQLCLINDAQSKLQKMCVELHYLEKGMFTSFNQKGHPAGM